MNTEELKMMGQAYLEGKNGMSKNPAKACEYFLQAAEGGDPEGMKYYAAAGGQADPERVLPILKKYNWKEKFAGMYIQALMQKGEYGKQAQEEVLAMWDRCGSLQDVLAFGDYLDASGCGDKEQIRKAYSVAMVMAKSDMRETLRARLGKYGMQENIVDGRAYREAMRRGLAYGTETQVVKKKIGREMADAFIAERKSALSKEARQIVDGVRPEVVFEYQLVYGDEAYVDSFTYSFTHHESDSLTKHSGSGEIRLNAGYASYVSNFIYAKNMNKFLDEAEMDDKIPDERINVGIDAVAVAGNFGTLWNCVRDAKEAAVKRELRQSYAWNSAAIDVTNMSSDDRYSSVAVLVPFYFYIYRQAGKTLTLRVNGSTGEVEEFKNNPFSIAEKKKSPDSKKAKSKKKFSFGIFLLLTLVTGVGGILYLIYCLARR